MYARFGVRWFPVPFLYLDDCATVCSSCQVSLPIYVDVDKTSTRQAQQTFPSVYKLKQGPLTALAILYSMQPCNPPKRPQLMPFSTRGIYRATRRIPRHGPCFQAFITASFYNAQTRLHLFRVPGFCRGSLARLCQSAWDTSRFLRSYPKCYPVVT